MVVALTAPPETASTVTSGMPFSLPSIWLTVPPPGVKSSHTVPASSPGAADAGLAAAAPAGSASGFMPTSGMSTCCPAWAGCRLTTAPFSATTGAWSFSRGRAPG